MVNQYPAVIGERGAYGVVIPDMRGLHALWGYTVDEALQNAETALAEFVMALEEDGQALPPPSAIEDVVLADKEMVAYVTLKIPVTT